MLFFIGHFALWFVLALPVYVLLRFLWLRKKKPPANRPREVVLCIFVCFMAALGASVFRGSYAPPADMARAMLARLAGGMGINLVPFETISLYIRHLSLSSFFVNVVGNVLLFIPWGFCLPLLWRKNQKFWRMLALAALLPLVIETGQLFIGRYCDIDDFILNFTGALLGWALYALALRLWPALKNLAAKPKLPQTND